MGLATAKDIEHLKRTVRSLEDELSRVRKQLLQLKE